MKSYDYIVNMLFKDNNISANIKNLQANFTVLDKRVNIVNQTINQVTNNISQSINQVNTNFVDLNTTVNQTTENIKGKAKSLDFNQFVNIARNLSDAFKNLSGSGSDFEQSMANLSATSGITGKDLDELNRIARESGKAAGIGATEAANAFTQLASQVQVSKMGLNGLKNLQKETITLSQASGTSMTESATALTDTINQFGLGAEQANRVVNLLAAGSKNGSVGIVDLAASLKTTGVTAAAAGVSVEQAAGALEVLSRNNQKGAEAGTALSGILASMQSNLNIDLSQTGLADALESLTPQLSNTSELARIFGEENLNAASFLIENASSVAEMTSALTDTNVAQEQAAIRTNTTAESMKVVQANIEDMKIGFFELTGGVSAYVAAAGDSLVMMAQLLPLFSGIGNGLAAMKNFSLEAAKASVLSAADTVKSHISSTVATARATAATVAHSVAQKTAAAATTVWTGVQTAFNAVMSANPIALAVLAIGALVGGIIAAYKNFDGFRKILDSAWDGVKKLGESVGEYLVKAFETLSSALGPVWSTLKALLGIEVEAEAATRSTAEAVDEYADSNEKAGTAAGQLSDALQIQNTLLNTNLNTLGGIEQKISDLQSKQKTVSVEHAAELEKEIELLKEKKNQMERSIYQKASGNLGKADTPLLDVPAVTGLNVQNPKDAGKGLIIPLKVADEDLLRAADEATKKLQPMLEQADMFAPIQQGLGGMASLMQNLSGVVGESAGAWLTWGSSLIQSIAQAIPQIIALTNTQVSSAVAQVTANTATAGTGAAASVASIPIVGWIMAGAAVASVIATLATLPKPKPMASGGIVYGNTFAQVGEYPGAANNPEVVAPLNKLRSLLQPASNGFGGQVEFVIKGNRLVGLLNKESNKSRYF